MLEFVIPSLGIDEFLDQIGEKTIDLPPQPPGVLGFTCGMGMAHGQIVFK